MAYRDIDDIIYYDRFDGILSIKNIPKHKTEFGLSSQRMVTIKDGEFRSSLPYDQIRKIELKKRFGLIPKEIRITNKDGYTFDMEINNIQKIMNILSILVPLSNKNVIIESNNKIKENKYLYNILEIFKKYENKSFIDRIVLTQDDISELNKFRDVYSKSYKIREGLDILEFKNENDQIVIIRNDLDLIYLNNEEKLKYIEDIIPIIEAKTGDSDVTYKKIEELLDIMTRMSIIYDNQSAKKYINGLRNYINFINIKNMYYSHRYHLLKNIKDSVEIGLQGEKLVNDYLELYNEEIINLPNIRIEIDGQSIENDNILITRKGIFILEVKNIGLDGRFNIRVERDGRWLKVYKNGKTATIDFDATTQNDRHVMLLKKFLNRNLNRTIEDDNYLDVKGIVVIANNDLTVENNSNQPIYRVSEVYRHINEFENIIKYDEMKIIKDILEKSKKDSKKYPIFDYKQEIYNNIDFFDNLIKSYNIHISELINEIQENFIHFIKNQ